MPVFRRHTLTVATAVATLAGAGMAFAAGYPGYPSTPAPTSPAAAKTPAKTNPDLSVARRG
jgi:hypothetical protein